MVKINFDEYDQISSMEDKIESIIKRINLKDNYIISYNKEENIRYVLTIISILYKQKCYEEYLEIITKTKRKIEIQSLNKIIEEIYKYIKIDNFVNASKTIGKYGFVVQEILNQYFNKKNTNYITKQHTIESLIKQNKHKELLKYNPLIINQLLKAMQSPLTQEEQIIEDIIEFIVESQQIFFDKIDITNYIKELMKNKYGEKELEKVISFIISDTYQEIKENPLDKYPNIIIPIIENERITKKDIINQFNENDKFSNIILETFVKYNIEIRQGRLEELEKKSSKKYAKKLY